MIISLCGDEFDKKYIIQELQKVYGEKLVVINYFQEAFNERITNESQKMSMTHEAFLNEIVEIVNTKITKIINNNRDKIIILISNNILEKEINKTPFFNISDLKILVTSDKSSDFEDPIFGHQILYNKAEFDYVINRDTPEDVRKLVRL